MASREEKRKAERGEKKTKQHYQPDLISRLFHYCTLGSKDWGGWRWEATLQAGNVDYSEIYNIIMCLDGPVYQTVFSGKDVKGETHHHSPHQLLPSQTPPLHLQLFFFPSRTLPISQVL